MSVYKSRGGKHSVYAEAPSHKVKHPHTVAEIHFAYPIDHSTMTCTDGWQGILKDWNAHGGRISFAHSENRYFRAWGDR